MFNYIEFVGILASILIVFSLIFKTRTFMGTLALRILNLLGSGVFVVYGCLLPAWSTAIANGCCVIIDIVFIIYEIRKHRNEGTGSNQTK